ncbi:Inorganic phosphate transporter pho84 [Orbilia brochopaga]|uniref:Inorganic phosphate transporter pho84 n=1 Tax=Orbilia brochopaga TaxID=3140254 RepID=A0AAV9U3K3_9PEZI
MSPLRAKPTTGVLTPVREESGSSTQPSIHGTPYTASIFSGLARSELPPPRIGSDHGRGRSGRPSLPSRGVNQPDRENGPDDSRPTVGDTSTVMASPTIPDEKKREKKKYEKYRRYTYMAATMSNTVEAYAIILPAILELFFIFTLNPAGHTGVYNIPRTEHILFNLSVFLGIPIGSIAATQLSRRCNDKIAACVFTALIFVGILAATLAGTGLSVPILPVLICFRVLTGIGIGGCRAVNALASVRLTTAKWRGLRMSYISAHSTLGYLGPVLAGMSALWLWGRNGPHVLANDCRLNCKVQLDKSWRLVSGAVLVSIVFAIFGRIKSSRSAPHPQNTSRVILKFLPSFEQFTKTYHQHTRYLYPFVHLCMINFSSSITFYAMLFNLRTILEYTRFPAAVLAKSNKSASRMNDIFAERPVTEYIRRMLVGYAIMIGLGIGIGYIVLGSLVDVWGRKRMLLLSYSLLAILFIVLAGCWERLNMEVSLLLVCLSFILQVTGPIGVAYVYATELFPRAYRNWCFLIVDVVGCLGAIAGISAGTIVIHLGATSSGATLNGIRYGWAMFAACTFVGLVSSFGLIETARKEIGVIEGENYGDWGKWGDRRRMRPEGAQDDDGEA